MKVIRNTPNIIGVFVKSLSIIGLKDTRASNAVQYVIIIDNNLVNSI